jgi:hypothetical protein
MLSFNFYFVCTSQIYENFMGVYKMRTQNHLLVKNKKSIFGPNLDIHPFFGLKWKILRNLSLHNLQVILLPHFI